MMFMFFLVMPAMFATIVVVVIIIFHSVFGFNAFRAGLGRADGCAGRAPDCAADNGAIFTADG